MPMGLNYWLELGGRISRYTIKLTLQIYSYPLVQQGGIGPYEFFPCLLLTVDKARAGPEDLPSPKSFVRVHLPTTCSHIPRAGADCVSGDTLV